MLAVIREEIGRLSERLEAGSGAADETMQRVLAVIREETGQLAGRLEAMESAGDDRGALESALEGIHEGVTRLEARIEEEAGSRGNALDPVLDLLKENNARLVHSQSQALHDVLTDVAVRGADGDVALDPILAAVKAEGERQLAYQGETLNRLASDLMEMKVEAGRLAERLEAGLRSPDDTLEPMLEMIRTELSQLSVRLESGREDGAADRLGPMLEAVHEETRRLADAQEQTAQRLSMRDEASMEPLLEMLRVQGEQLVERQIQVMRETIGEITVRSAAGELSLEPVLVAMKVGEERFLARQEAAVQSVMGGVVADLAQMRVETSRLVYKLDGESDGGPEALLEAVVAVVQSELTRLADGTADTLRQVLSDSGVIAEDGDAALGPVMAAMRDEMNRLGELHQLTIRDVLGEALHGVSEGLSMEPVLEAIRVQGAVLAENQSRALNEIMTELEVRGVENRLTQDLMDNLIHEQFQARIQEPIIQAVRDSGDRLLTRQEDLLNDRIGAVVADLGRVLAPDEIVNSVRSETIRISQQISEAHALESDAIESVMEALRVQSQQRVAERTDALRDAVRDIAEPGSGVEVFLDQVLRAVEETSANILLRMAEIPRPEAINDLIRIENERMLQELIRQTSVEPLIDTLNAQRDALAHEQTEALRLAASEVIEGIRDASDSKPVLEALQRQGDRLAEALEQRPTLEDLRGVMRVETERLSEGQQRLLQSQAYLADTQGQAIRDALAEGISLEPVLAAVREQGERISKNHGRALRETLDAIVVRDGDGGLSLDPLLAAVKNEGQRQLERQGEAMAEMAADLKRTLDPAPLIDVVKSETRQLGLRLEEGIRPDGFSLEPVMEALRNETALLMEQLRERPLAAVPVAAPSAPSLEPVLEAIRAQGDRFIEQSEKLAREQERSLRDVLGEVAVRGADGEITIEPILAAVKAEVGRLSQSLADGRVRGELSVEPVIRALREETANLAEAQRWMIQEAVAGTRSALDPVLEAIHDQSAELTESQDRAMRYAMNSVAARSDEQVAHVALEPIVEVIRAESERLLARQEQAIQEALNGAAFGTQAAFPPQVVIDTIRSETARLTERLAERADGAPQLDPVIDALRRETANLADVQQWLVEEAMNGARLTLEPVTQAIQEQGSLLSAELNRSLRDILTSMASTGRLADGDLEPVLAAVKAEGDRLLTRQDELVRRETDRLAQRLGHGPTRSEMLDAVQSQGDRLSAELDRRLREPAAPAPARPSEAALERAAAAAGIDGATLLELLQSMSRFLAGQFGLKLAPLNAILSVLIARLQHGAPVYDAEVIGLLKDFGDQSVAYIHSADMEPEKARAWDQGFMKTAIALQGYLRDLGSAYSAALAEEQPVEAPPVAERSAPTRTAPPPVPPASGTDTLRSGVAGVFEELEKSLFKHFIKRGRADALAAAAPPPRPAVVPPAGRTTAPMAAPPAPPVAPPVAPPALSVAPPVAPPATPSMPPVAPPVAPPAAPPVAPQAVQRQEWIPKSGLLPRPQPEPAVKADSEAYLFKGPLPAGVLDGFSAGEMLRSPDTVAVIKSLPAGAPHPGFTPRASDYQMKTVIFSAFKENLDRVAPQR